MHKPGILFVDDEPNILAGIQRMLRSMRKEFDFFFAENGRQALDIMESENIIIIISDMRMPSMSGDELLLEIQQRFPQTIRMMLTGLADDQAVMRTAGVVHQFLAKPCEPEKMQTILLRAGALYSQITDGHLKSMISGLGKLPSLPAIYARLQKVLANPDADIDDVARVIEQDMAMTAKLLQLVNSSFFGLFQRVESPARAVKLLGLETVKMLVLGVQIFSEMKAKSHHLPLETLFQHSMAVAQCSKKIALQATDDDELINSCFLAGMVHDIGKLLLLTHMGSEYDTILEAVQTDEKALINAELDTFKASHGDIGAYLIGLWGFSGDIVEAVAFHHAIEKYPGEGFSAALAVHLADCCYYERYPEAVLGQAPQRADSYLERINLKEDAERWRQVAHEFYENSENGV
ncbi:MAG: HDOD domain-containing protein [Desulfopila sp.]